MLGWLIRALIALLAALNLGWAAVTIIDPVWAADLLGLRPEGPAAFGELRAVYGGLVGGLGVVMALAALRRPLRAWYGALAILFLGLTGGRVVSLFADGSEPYTWVALALEGATALVLLAACRWAPHPRT